MAGLMRDSTSHCSLPSPTLCNEAIDTGKETRISCKCPCPKLLAPIRVSKSSSTEERISSICLYHVVSTVTAHVLAIAHDALYSAFALAFLGLGQTKMADS